MKEFQRNTRLAVLLHEIKGSPDHLLTSFDVNVLLQIINERDQEIAQLRNLLRDSEIAYSSLSWEKNP